MARYKFYNQEQHFFQVIDPVAFRESNSLLRVIDEFVEEHLPVEQFSLNMANDEMGAEALDPRLVVKVLFYSIASGIRSYRSIEDRLKWDPCFLILSGQKVFDHSTLCRFIWRHKKPLTDFFTIMVYILIKQGHMTKDFFGTDGTKIKASAGKDFTGTLGDFQRRSKKLEKKIEELLSKMGNESPDPDRPEKIRNLERKKKKIDDFLEQVKGNPERIESKEKINLTDPDARIMKDKDTTYPGYNLQLSVDANHFIAAYGLFTCTADQPHLKPMIDKLEQQFSSLAQTALLFDAGYYSGENILFLESKNLNAYIPEGQAEDGSRVFRSKKGVGSRDCRINPGDPPVLICPGNQSITGRLYKRSGSKRVSYRFYANKQECSSCTLRQRCYGKRTNKCFEPEKISVDSYQARLRMREKVASQDGTAKRNLRFSTGEHVNGEIKDQMRLRQFFHRGKDKLQTISALAAIGYNFRRLAAVS